ncbi:Spo0E family sporulation regulatory protein-aspartic acid phosphatase [Peribacillus frigoritolerans]|uniref:Spo0E family sporulation regulatory protein-aspartic acid phosphatase n=1 Tax=Peribacillus frigoritolerans TaxID=450367 RepID=UPI00380ED662
MFFKKILDLRKRIEGNRQKMYVLAMNKGVADPETIKISQELDRQILSFQKILAEIKSQSA